MDCFVFLYLVIRKKRKMLWDINFYGCCNTYVVEYTWCIGRTESVHPEEKRQRQTQIAFFHYLWWIFKEYAARLLIVLNNERRDLWHNLQETVLKTEKNGGKKSMRIVKHWKRCIKGVAEVQKCDWAFCNLI